MPSHVLMIDNYDSFAYNLVQYFGELGCHVSVYRNDEITIAEIRALKPDYIVISPGPCTPNEAGISLDIVEHLSDEFPILGVCLGHQSIAQALGGEVIHANNIMHGKVSAITHDGSGLYEGLPSPLTVTRYHSLVACAQTLPPELTVTARVDDEHGAIMSFAHKHKPLYGVQYHPEAILTEHGKSILRNFLYLGAHHELTT